MKYPSQTILRFENKFDDMLCCELPSRALCKPLILGVITHFFLVSWLNVHPVVSLLLSVKSIKAAINFRKCEDIIMLTTYLS